MKKPNNGQWKRGQSGNPKGRPKGSTRLAMLMRRGTYHALEQILEMIKSPDTDDRVKFRAIKEWLERSLGKVQPDLASALKPDGESVEDGVSMVVILPSNGFELPGYSEFGTEEDAAERFGDDAAAAALPPPVVPFDLKSDAEPVPVEVKKPESPPLPLEAPPMRVKVEAAPPPEEPQAPKPWTPPFQPEIDPETGTSHDMIVGGDGKVIHVPRIPKKKAVG